MNWLAHLFLSEPSAEFRIGNLLPDLMRPRELQTLPLQFVRGAERHRQIDAFTDSHPVVRRSIRRLSDPYRRYGGILVDIFYDHFLAVDWSEYSEISLDTFVSEAYASIDACQAAIPAEVFARLNLMRSQDWLRSYRELAGISVALERVGRRLSKPVDLAASVIELRDQYEDFHGDFREFFPALRAHCLAKTVGADGTAETL